MTRSITEFTVVVRDYDEAIDFYSGKLGFELLEDTDLGGGKRWVRVGPGPDGCGVLLARAVSEQQRRHVGEQTGGRVAAFLDTDDFWRDHAAFSARGVRFIEAPREESYGTVAVFTDLYGNRWDLIQRRGT